MVPPIITDKLAGLRRAEKTQRLVFGLGRLLAVVLVALLVACAIDFVIDRFDDTPIWVRATLLLLQIALALILLTSWVVLPLCRRLPDDALALWVEEKYPRLAHRLISAVQFNRPAARKEGMSVELIQVVTREAETHAERLDFNRVVDNRRLGIGLAFFLPALLIFGLALLLWPLLPTLLARQFLADVEIPRSVYLTAENREVWPKGEKVRLEIKATGPGVTDDLEGELRIDWDRADMDASYLPLKRVPGSNVFYADVPAAAVNFSYKAYAADGRMRVPGSVRYEPRPEVREQAFVQLPLFCGARPDKSPYEQPASRGDVEAIPGSSVRVSIETQKKVKRALLHLFAKAVKGNDEKGNPIWEEEPRGVVPIMLDKTKQRGDVVFPLIDSGPDGLKSPAPYSHYEIEVVDEYGFDNRPRPARNLRVIPEPRPEVTLLREQFPSDSPVPARYADLYVHSGMPAVEGANIRVGYRCFGPYGLGMAVMQYRKVARSESGNDEVKEEDWTELFLPEETRINPKTGKEEDLGEFLPEQGVFRNTPPDKSVGFYPVPSPDPDSLGRITGGGRYDLKLSGLVTAKGRPLKLKKGDQLEYRIKIYADRKGSADRPWNVSETRVTAIEDSQGVWEWLTSTINEVERIRGLEKGQRSVFEKIK